MPKGQIPKLEGAICNIPIETADITDILPQEAGNNDVLML